MPNLPLIQTQESHMGHWLPDAHVSFLSGMLDKEKIHVYCRAIKTMSWLNIIRGFIPKRDTMAYIQAGDR